jgi:cytochrome c oxidase cbb3-type subunit 3/ubiquinol-cytochrome c reductase cytochrome c subunit
MIRATIVCGRPDVGMPDWQGNLNGKPVPQLEGLAPLSNTQIEDLMAWITSHRVAFPGQPYSKDGNTSPGF